jgi:heme exporter protein D
MSEFFAMGGYAAYVWPSYALAFIILVGNIIAPMQQRKKIVSDIARKIRRARNEQK